MSILLSSLALAMAPQAVDPAGSLQRIDVPADPRGAVVLDVNLSGAAAELVLEPHSIRAGDFAVYVTRPDGSVIQVPAPEPKTWRGTVTGWPTARVIASITDEGLTAIVVDETLDSEWQIQPALGHPAGVYSVALKSELDIPPAQCGGALGVPTAIEEAAGAAASGARGTGLRLAEVAMDADFEFYQLNGSSVSATINDMERVMNRVDDIYVRDSDVTFQLTAMVVRTSAADPYSSSDAGTLLDQFRAEWSSNFVGVRRDIAHLFTGRNINGGTIGVAWLGAVCGSLGYGLSESRFTSNISARTGLTAHEIGHNFNQNHCDGQGDCRIMCSGLGGCQNDVTRFGTNQANGIRNYAAGRSCMIDLALPLAVPFTDDVPSATVNTDIWISNQGVVASTAALGEPSPSRSFEFNARDAGVAKDDVLISNKILLGGQQGFDVFVSVENRGVAAGNSLVVEMLDAANDWLEVIRVTSTGASESSFTTYNAPVPAGAYHDEAQLRIRAEVNGTTENWYVDDVAVTNNGCAGGWFEICTGNANSTGNSASLLNAGSTSISANDFELVGSSYPSNQFGIVIYGGGFTFTPLGDGILCVAGTPTLYRLLIFQADFLGLVDVPIDLNNLAPGSTILPGDVVNWQTWYRDGTPGGFNFSSAINVTFCP